jgi:transcriptional regulator
MYMPPAFEEKDPDLLWGIVRAMPLGLLISQGDGNLLANLIPFEVVPGDGNAMLRAHLAKANPQWRDLAGQNVLAVFQGANAYVTPQWYESKREHGKVVPTWNYAVVQVRGTARVIEDRDWLLAQVNRLTDHHEAQVGQGASWKVSDAPDDFIQSQLKGIVGIEIDVISLTGKVKASQNRQAADRAGVVDGLTRRGSGMDMEMAKLVPTVDP